MAVAYMYGFTCICVIGVKTKGILVKILRFRAKREVPQSSAQRNSARLMAAQRPAPSAPEKEEKRRGSRPTSTALQPSLTQYPPGSLQLSQVEARQRLQAAKRLDPRESAGYRRQNRSTEPNLRNFI